MLQYGTVRHSGHKKENVSYRDIQREGNVFVGHRKLLGDPPPPVLTAEAFPQGSLFHNQEVEEGFWVN